MASRFMKIKRVVIPFMTLVVMTSQLAGCATMTSDEMLKSMNESPDVSIEYAIPDPGKQSLDASEVINVGDQQFVSDSDTDSDDIGLIENQGTQELEEISHDELIAIFEENYEISKSIYNSDDEEVIRSELEMIKIIVKSMDKSLPSDYETQYRAWRPSVNQQTQQASEVVLTFTDCNETVYATGTVNLRSGPSTEDEKVGALNKNQSVTRIGIGTGDYASWSKVKLSDGSEVYVASKYLTTTKPVSQPSIKPSGGGTSSTAGSQQTQGGATIIDDTEGLNIVSGSDFNKTIITDQNELDTGLDDPYASYGKVTIGYGGSGG
ncbi:MAG: SH3 domain-containing protein [Oscillospiraceae bacterium]